MTGSKAAPNSGRRNSPWHSGAIPAQPGLSGRAAEAAAAGLALALPWKPEASVNQHVLRLHQLLMLAESC